MTAVAYVPLLIGLLTFLSSGLLGRTLSPAAAVRLGTALALTVAVMTGLVLSVAAVLSVRTLQAATHESQELSGGSRVASVAAGIVAAVVVAILLGCAVRHFLRSTAALVRASAGSRQLGPVHSGLIVVHDTLPTAFAVAGIPGHVVVSTAMLQALGADERRVLLAHEAAHVHHHHHLYVQLAQLAAAANPLLRPLARAVRRNTERWADEVAADEVGDRRVVARALTQAALARRSGAVHNTPGGDGQLPHRIRMLQQPPPPRTRSSLLSAAVIAIVLACAGSGATAVFQGHQQIERLEFTAGVGAPFPGIR